MPKSLKADSTPLLVSRAFAFRAQIDELEVELKAIEAELMTRGVGKLQGAPGQELTVVIPVASAPSYKLPKEKEGAARELVDDLDLFKKLFDREVVYSPCKGFADLAPKLLTPARSRDLLALCIQPAKKQKPYVRYPSK